MPPKRKTKATASKRDKPLSLYGMNFVEAVDKLLAAKPTKKTTPKKAS